MLILGDNVYDDIDGFTDNDNDCILYGRVTLDKIFFTFGIIICYYLFLIEDEDNIDYYSLYYCFTLLSLFLFLLIWLSNT